MHLLLSVKGFLKDDVLSIFKVSIMPNTERQRTVQGRENLVTVQLEITTFIVVLIERCLDYFLLLL